MKCFKGMIMDCDLNDIGFKGHQYIWFGIREGEVINERLDRRMANIEWMQEFPNMAIINLPVVGSNHSSIILNCDYKDGKTAIRFKF